jgi:hypothetical protein
MSNINAAPMVIERGTQDLSKKNVVGAQYVLPQHLAKFYIYAKKGPTKPQLCDSNLRSLVYGNESFDPKGKFTTHSTMTANAVNSAGNVAMLERVIPSDASVARLYLYLDVLSTMVETYSRNADGSIYYTEDGEMVPLGKVSGYSCVWKVRTL